MTLTIQLDAATERRLSAEASRNGLPMEEYARRLIQTYLPGPEDEDPARLAALLSEDTLNEIWGTPEEDEAWKHL